MWSGELEEAFWYLWGWMIIHFLYHEVFLVDMFCPSVATSDLKTPYNTYKETYTVELISQL